MGMKAPDPGINEFPVFLLGTRTSNQRLGENTMTSIQPTVWTPYETVEGFMTILNAPAIEQDFMRTIGFVIPVGIRNEDQFGRHANIDPVHTHSNTRAKREVFGKSLLLIKNTICVHILKNLNAVSLVGTVFFPGLIIIIFQGPKPPSEIKTKGYGFANIRLGHEGLDLKTFQSLHLGNGLFGSEKGCITGLRLRPH